MERRKIQFLEYFSMQRQPDNVYQMHGSQISVKTLDLNQPFAEIANQMDRIVESHFSGLTKEY